jgi:hypothetical protein
MVLQMLTIYKTIPQNINIQRYAVPTSDTVDDMELCGFKWNAADFLNVYQLLSLCNVE